MLEIFKCRDYLCLANDVTELYNLKVSSEGFNLLLEILSKYDIIKDYQLIKLIKNNLHVPLEELSNSGMFGKNNDNLIKQLMKKNKFIALFGEVGNIKLWDVNYECMKTLSNTTIRKNGFFS